MTRERPRDLRVRALHLFALSAFALAQPLFDLLGDTPEFFVVRGSTTVDIVAFAVALIVLPPLVLVALEALAGLVDARAGDALHLLFVAALVALVAVQALKRVDRLSPDVVFAGAAAIGVAAAALYYVRPVVRTFASVLAVVPLVFLALFLVNSPLEKLSLESEAHARDVPPVASRTPIVVVVFDELPVTSLMDRDRRIDAGRYPSFASLASDSTWFRGATTVHEHTTEAVPAIMTGKEPQAGRLPLLDDHPDNLFTFLGGSYGMHVFEPVTQLCPTDLCPRARESFAGRMGSLAEDVGLVYLHVLLPEESTHDLPSVSDTWQNFGREHADEQLAAKPLALRNAADVDRAVGRQLWSDVAFQAERYAATIKAEERPTLYFLHALLPHSPWRYLPSGRQYAESLGIEGLGDDTWGDNEWLVAQGYERHLLQVGFTDRVLGLILDRLREERIYDRALVVVVADHGVSFRTGDRRRGVTPTNIHDIAPVPLLVKRPGQTKARIVDRPVQTIDIVPTIADVLGADLPYEADGRSLFDPATVNDRVVIAQRVGAPVAAAADDVAKRKFETAEHMTSLFGSGSWERLFRVGPSADLIGRGVQTLDVVREGGPQATVATQALLGDVDLRSSLSPSHIPGRLDGDGAEPGIDLAVAVNGRVAAVTETYEVADDVKFDAWAPEAAFRDGANDVQLYAVEKRGGASTLVPLGGTGEAAGYELDEADGAIRTSRGRAIAVRPGAVEGEVEDWFFERDTVRIGGWAGVIAGHRAADTVLIFSNGELVYSGSPSVGRADLAEQYPGLGRSGFVAQLPKELAAEDAVLRVYAIDGGVASELAFDPEFPWRP